MKRKIRWWKTVMNLAEARLLIASVESLKNYRGQREDREYLIALLQLRASLLLAKAITRQV